MPAQQFSFGGALSSVDILATLFGKMNFNKNNFQNPERDRFILSKGHGCLVYYSILNILNIINDDELKTLKKMTQNYLVILLRVKKLVLISLQAALAWDFQLLEFNCL